MSSNAPATTVDCRGLQCPAPILETAKAARKLANGGVLRILADDDAFPLDIKSWCRSSKATLLEVGHEQGSHCAFVRVSPKGGRAKPRAAASQLRAVPEVVERKQIDCIGQQCPQPILTLAKAVRGLEPGTEVEVVADDPAFPLDVSSWVRSAKAEVLEMHDATAPYRAVIRVGGGAAGKTNGAAAKPAAPVERVAPVAPALAPVAPAPPASMPLVVDAVTIPAPKKAAEGGDLHIDLSYYAASERMAELTRAIREAGAVRSVTIVTPDRSFNNEMLQWCTREGHTLRSLNGYGPVTAVVDLRSGGVVVVPSPMTDLARVEEMAPSNALALVPDNRCSLLVLHNDHEALLAAMLIATGAAASGMDVSIFFTFWGLNLLRGDRPNPAEKPQKVSFIQRLFKLMMPSGTKKQKLGQMNFGGAGKGMLNMIMKDQNLMLLPDLIDSAQDQGVRFIACTMSMSVMGITKRDLHPYETLEYGGVATFVEQARGSAMHLVF